MSRGVRVLEVTERRAMGEIGQCVVSVWRLQPNPEDMETRNVALRALCARHPGNCALVEVIEPTSKPPTEQTRRAAMEVFEELGDKLSFCTFTLEGDALKVTVARAVLTAMAFFIKQVRPTKVCRNIPEMLAHVQRELRDADPELAESLQRAIETLRAQIP